MTIVLTRFTTAMHITNKSRELDEFLMWYIGDRVRQSKVFTMGEREPVNCVHILDDKKVDIFRERDRHYNEMNIIKQVMRTYEV